jgi:hypothetical protein
MRSSGPLARRSPRCSPPTPTIPPSAGASRSVCSTNSTSASTRSPSASALDGASTTLRRCHAASRRRAAPSTSAAGPKGRHVTEVFDELGPRTVTGVKPTDELGEFVRHAIGPLVHHDRANHTDLVDTLAVWLETRNMAEAARRIHSTTTPWRTASNGSRPFWARSCRTRRGRWSARSPSTWPGTTTCPGPSLDDATCVRRAYPPTRKHVHCHQWPAATARED